MEFKENTRALEDFESLHQTNVVLLRKNKALHMKKKNLTTEKEALQKRMKDLMGQDTKDNSSVPETTETDETDSQEQTTTPDDCESFHQANEVLIQKNKALRITNDNLSGDIESLQKKISDLISPKTQATSSVSEMARESTDWYLQNRKFWGGRETLEENTRTLKKSDDKLRIPKTDKKETQTLSVCQDMEDVNKLLLQEKEAWEAEKKKLQQEITILTKENCEVKEKERQALRVKDAIAKEAKMNLMALDKEKETLCWEITILTKQKCEVEDKEKVAMQVNEALQREVLELQTSLQKEKQLSDINVERVRAHTREDALRAELEEAEAVHSFDELLVEELKEEVNVLCKRVRVLEEQLKNVEGSSFREEQDLGSEPDRLSMRRRVVRLFNPGWRRRYFSRETLEHVESGVQAREETQRRPTLWERFLKSCTT